MFLPRLSSQRGRSGSHLSLDMAQRFSDADAGVALRRVLRVAAEVRLGRVFRRRRRGRVNGRWRGRQMPLVVLVLGVFNQATLVVGRPAVQV